MHFEPISASQPVEFLAKKIFFKEPAPNTLQTLTGVLSSAPPCAIDMWNRIIDAAQEKNRLSSFDAEVLSRLKEVQLLAQESIYRTLDRIFSSHENAVDIFLHLATTYRCTYYDALTFQAILIHFSRFLDAIGPSPLSSYANSVSCYDQGGKEWLDRCLATLRLSNYVQDHVELWSGLPSSEQIQQAQQLHFPVVHSHAFQTWIGESEVSAHQPHPLSLHQLFSRMLFNLTADLHRWPMKKYEEVVQLLESADYQNIFTESDRVHLLQIVIYLSTQPEKDERKGSALALMQTYKMVKEGLGDAIFLFVSNPLCYQHGVSLQNAIQLIQQLLEVAPQIDELTPILVDFYKGTRSLQELKRDVKLFKEKSEEKKYPEKPLERVMQAFRLVEDFPLDEKTLVDIEEEYNEICRLGLKLREGGMDALIHCAKEIQLRCVGAQSPISRADKLSLIAIGREAIRIQFGIYPYNTQILCILGILTEAPNLKGRMAQVKTGQGKSTLVSLLTFYFACQGKMVDIISSSRYLAERDQEDYAEFFQAFGITSSHICEDNPTVDHFKGQILYGINSDFEFAVMKDYLRQETLRKIPCQGKLRPRPFDVVLVDEVDNLVIDSALNSARLSIPGTNKLNWVYQPILHFIKKKMQINPTLLAAIFRSQNRSFIKNLIEGLKTELHQLREEQYKELVRSLSPQKFEQKFETWLRSAYTALYEIDLKKDYVIKKREIPTTKGKICQLKIIPVDRNTGRRQEGCRLQNGVHEFLEAKHGLDIEEESLMPASLCHPIFFGYYEALYGLSGTMGPEIERNEVQEIYKVDSFDVPPHQTNCRELWPPLVLSDGKEYLDEIVKEIQLMQQAKRPILVLCESILKTEEFAALLNQHNLLYQLLNEEQAENEAFVVAKAGDPKAITIATNTAGRGTDIRLHPTSLENGGLHVIFSFYPENDRVEAQGLGRAGRQGQPGSGRLILHSAKNIGTLIKEREDRIESSSSYRKMRSKNEALHHTYLQPFFEQIENWQIVINDPFLEEIDKEWQEKIKDERPKLSQQKPPIGLDSRELELYETFIHHIKYAPSQDFPWLPFLKNVWSTLLNKIQQNWAESFYGELDDLYHQSQRSQEGEEFNYEKVLKELHESQKLHWEKYLDSPKHGFRLYLNELNINML